VYNRSDGVDGYVSVEVSPDLAHDTEATVVEAREWVKRIDRPNLLIKVPATPPGIPAVRQLIAEGISVNVTLIFALDRYREVMEAYLCGLEGFLKDNRNASRIASVASFFVSRVDTEVDKRLEAIGSDDALALRGKAAIANARAAYGAFLETFAGDRWNALASSGGRLQRPLWASTSTKNPAYKDVMYVENLVADDTVNTIPLSTIEAYQDHGNPDPDTFTTADIEEAIETLAELGSVGVDYDDVVQVLEDEGVAKFADAITASLESPELALFRRLVDDYEQEHDVSVADIAAALAVLSQDGESFLLKPEPPATKRAKERDRGPSSERAPRGRGEKQGSDRGAGQPRGAGRSQSGGPMATYRIRVGRRHKISPGSIVGAIANEGGLTRADFGHIDIQADHSLVELPVDLSADTFERLRRTRISGQLIGLTLEEGASAGDGKRGPRK